MWSVVAGAGSAATACRLLILNGHTDVVSPASPSAWSFDPFGAQVVVSKDGRRRMYERGALDMKGRPIANL